MNYALALPLLLAFLAASSGSGETFRNPHRIVTPTDPDGILVADLNGDGRLDIVATYEPLIGQSMFEAFLAQPDGGYSVTPVQPLPTGVTPYCQLADETRDGKPDLICPYVDQFNASLMVFPGNGDGTFGAPIETALPSSEQFERYWAPVLGPPADFNGDGVDDFLVLDADSGTEFTLLGNGDGTFRLVIQKDPSAPGENPYQAIDINHDGHIDLLFPNGSVLLGDGTGQFKRAPFANAGGGYCVFGKIDGEPHIDEVCGQGVAVDGDIVGGTQLLIFHGNGDGSFNLKPVKTITYGDRTNVYNGYGTFETPIAIADLNSDGIPDIVAEAGDGLTVLLGAPGANFSYPEHYATGYNSFDAGVVGPFAFRIADLNGDGLPDIVQSGPNGVYVTYGRPDGVLDTAPAYELTQVIGFETVADFDGDGIPDIAATGDQAIELSLGRGDGTFEYRRPLPRGEADFSTPPSAANARILHGDFNGDHHQDIIAIGSSSIYQYNDYILFGHGDGTFTAPALIANTSMTYPGSHWPQAFDFNRDGKDDLFTFDSGHLYVALSNGDGSFKTVTTTISPTANLQTQAAIADVNGDGKLDAVFGSHAKVEIFAGRGDGSFNPSPLRLSIPPYKGVPVHGSIAVAVGDFDADGHKDIAVIVNPGTGSQPSANPYGSQLFVFFGQGAGKFSAGVPVKDFNRAYTNLYAADLNEDKLDDLVLKQSGGLDNGDAIAIVHSLPGRKFGPEESYYAGTGLADLAIVDLNRDGFPDLVVGNGVYNLGANSATVLMNLGNSAGVTGFVSASTEPSDAASSFRLVASLDPPDHSALTGSVRFFIDGQPVGSANLVDNQAGITVNKSYPAGLHSLKAEWPGDTAFAGVTLVGEHQVVDGYPTSTSIVTHTNPSPFLTAITFLTVVQSTSGTPAGSVALLDGKTTLATVRLNGGSANFKTSALSPGKHAITAKYLPAPGWAPSSNSLQQEIAPINATVSLTYSPSIVYALAPVTFSAEVKGPGPAATGTIQFSIDSSTVGSAKLVDGATSVTESFATPGSHYIGADYSGNQDYNPGSAYLESINVLANSTVTSLTAAPNPAVAAQPITFAAQVSSSTVSAPVSGTVEFIDNGGQIGSAQLTNGSASLQLSSLAVGTHPIVASYTGTGSFNASQSTTLSLVIQPASSTTTLSASPNPASVSSTVTLQAVVTGPRQPTGSITFFDGATQLSKAIAVDVTGTSTFSTTSLAAGTHTIVADYSGDSNLNPSASAPLTVTITQ